METLVPEVVFQRGQVVARKGALTVTLRHVEPSTALLGTVHLKEPLEANAFRTQVLPGQNIRAIRVVEHSLGTGSELVTYTNDDPTLNQLSVIERHRATGRQGHGYLLGFGLARGAIASTVAHDAHNLMVVGANTDQGRQDMATVANHVAAIGGGQAVCLNGEILAEVPLPIAGLMADVPVTELGQQVTAAQNIVRQTLGSSLEAPFMTLSFLGLSVIPSLKLTDRGLIDVERFAVTPLIVG